MSQHAREHPEDYVPRVQVHINPMRDDDECEHDEVDKEICLHCGRNVNMNSDEWHREKQAESILTSQHDFDDYVPNRTP